MTTAGTLANVLFEITQRDILSAGGGVLTFKCVCVIQRTEENYKCMAM